MLVLELRREGVCSLPALAQQWRRDPAYLKSAVELWIKLGSRQDFERAWLDAIRSAVAALSAAAATAAAAKAAAAAGAVASGAGGEGEACAAPGPADNHTGQKSGENACSRKKKRKKTGV